MGILSEPVGRDAKSWKLNSLLSDLEQLEVEGFADELPVEAAPAFSIELLGGGQALLTARLSAAAGTSYLQQEGDDAVYVVSADDLRRVGLGYRRRGSSTQKAGCTRRQQRRRPQRRRR